MATLAAGISTTLTIPVGQLLTVQQGGYGEVVFGPGVQAGRSSAVGSVLLTFGPFAAGVVTIYMTCFSDTLTYTVALPATIGTGSGVPVGGTTDQGLFKNSGADGDASWKVDPALAAINASIATNTTAIAGKFTAVDASNSVKGLLQFGGALAGSSATVQQVLGATTATGLETALAAVRVGPVNGSVIKAWAANNAQATMSAAINTDQALASGVLPAMGLNASIRVSAKTSKVGTAGSQLFKIKIGGVTLVNTSPGSTNLTSNYLYTIQCANSATLKRADNNSILNGLGGSTVARDALYTTAATNVAGVAWSLEMQRGNAGDTVNLDGYSIEILDPDLVVGTSGGGSAVTNWQTVTPNVNGTSAVTIDWLAGPNVKITAIPGAAQPVSVIANVPDGAEFQINLDNGGFSGLWTTYSTGAPTVAGYVWMGGGGAVATTGDALLTIPIFGKRDGFVYYVQAGYPVPKP